MGVRKTTMMRRCNSLVTSIIGCLTIAFLVLNKVLMTEPELQDSSSKITGVGVTTTLSWDSKLEKNLEISDSRHQAHRFVTPSLAEIGGRRSMPEMNDYTLMITRLPGAGAELLVLILQRLQGSNAFKHIRLPPGDENLLTTLQQELLVEDITIIMKREAVPLTFDADLRFLNFSAFGRQAPTFISMARNPLDPKILKRYNKEGVDPTYCGSIAYFCGQDPRCTHENRTWAMREAQANIERWYPVVGLLEHVEVTLKILEKTFPYFFKGASEVYSKFHVKKKIPSKTGELKIVSLKEKISTEYLAKEVEFYLWLKSRLFHPKSDNG